MHSPVIGFVGPSGVGKTTLLERLVPLLEALDLRVGVVKHSSHAVEADRPGKDSHRLCAAGATAVALAMPGQIATFARQSPGRPSLECALETLPDDLDVILVEGFAWEPIPRYALLPSDGTDARGDLTDPLLVRAIRMPRPGEDAGPLQLDPALVRGLALEIAERIARPGPAAPEHVPLPLEA
jgi:molybdopterin-guanine dinucleotide biosynthesis protein MobB